MKRMWQAIGGVLVLLAVAALVEANRLQQYKAGFGFGAGTFPFMLGVALLILGAYLALTAGRDSTVELRWPERQEALAIAATIGTLVVYSAALPVLGYVSATFLVSAALFRIIGGYRWPRSIVGGAVTSALLYVVFERVADVSLPSGLIG